MIKNLRVKLVALILSMMLISGVFTVLISLLISSGSIEREAIQTQNEIAKSIIELDANSDFSLNKIMELSSNKMYKVTQIINPAEYKGDISSLKNEEYIQIKRSGISNIETILKLDNKYLKISSFKSHKNGMFQITTTAILISILIATIISGLISERVLRPVRDLSKATKEVAKGDFSVRVVVPKDYEFGFLTENFNKMVKELNSIETLRNDFVSNVSHEIKTPLASIQGFAKLLQDDNFSVDERKEFTDIIINESIRLSKLTSNILKLSKLENQEINTQKVKFSLDEQIRCAILIMEQEWNQKNLSLDIELDEVNIVENEDLLQQVWINLIGNAIKFTEDGGRISVKLKDLNERVVVEISDSGIGMNEETIRHMFDKFYQGDRSRLSEGNGLGLSLVRRIIDLCGGKIYIKSELGIGTLFIVELKKLDIL
ncbi:HAMP domain-containing histidine kinase [Clostridioides mangenotii]|uniref:sensor histidine kinase n=1 Tax=Metaclostridioides mangenotii TaxID=1540 RepID=UPI00214A568A|nr:HAMP domain-containing sensor histidine kinase [Clostridioides mangenotii]MCR1955647.1 HAMP domain-containing histidine kinase [Clostridioides mangenotii]